MVESLNTKVDLVVEGTAFTGLSNYGKIMVGDKGFEFYNSRDYNKFIQIPWEEVDYVVASIMFKGKWIPRYAIKTRKNGTYSFASRDTKRVLRGIRVYVGPNNIFKSLSFFEVISRGIKTLFKRKKIRVN